MKQFTFTNDPIGDALTNALYLLGTDNPKALSAAASALNMAYRALIRGPVKSVKIQFDPNGHRDVVYQSGALVQYVGCTYLPGFGRFQGGNLTVTVPMGSALHDHLMTLLMDFRAN